MTSSEVIFPSTIASFKAAITDALAIASVYSFFKSFSLDKFKPIVKYHPVQVGASWSSSQNADFIH